MSTEIVVPQPTVMEIIANAVMSKDVSIDVVERLVAMQRQMGKDEAERDFNDAMNRCQRDMKRINANMENPQTRSKYADYAQIDRAIRPIYTKEGFSLSFSDGEPVGPEMVRIVCYVSRGGHTRMYHKDMPIVTIGPQGKAVMTPTHATGSADAYAKRYLVKDIFNLAVGEDDNDGNGNIPDSTVTSIVAQMESAKTLADLKFVFGDAYKGAAKFPDVQRRYKEAYEKRKMAVAA